jgi:hypothetical protein
VRIPFIYEICGFNGGILDQGVAMGGLGGFVGLV